MSEPRALKMHHEYAVLLAWMCPCGRAHTDEEMEYGALECACGRTWHATVAVALRYEPAPRQRVTFRSSRPLTAAEKSAEAEEVA